VVRAAGGAGYVRCRRDREHPGVPIKMVWSREEDMTHDYRPISCAGWPRESTTRASHRHARSRLGTDQCVPESSGREGGQDDRQLQGYYEKPGDAQLGYTFPSLLIEYAMRNTHVPVGPWRGVNTNQNAVYMECFIDEVAKAAAADPVEFRRALMQKHPKHLAVLNAAAAKADWGKPLPAGVHRGVAQFMGYGSYSAAVAEVSVSARARSGPRMVLALDCGACGQSAQIAAQVEGSVAYGLSAALFGELTVENGRIAGAISTPTKSCASPTCRRSRRWSCRHSTSGAGSANRRFASDAGGPQRHLRGHRQTGPHAAAEEPEDRTLCKGMISDSRHAARSCLRNAARNGGGRSARSRCRR
jgi:hypothetical protein